MTREERRKKLLALLKESQSPVSGAKLARIFSVSRQVIVQDIAILRASEEEILSTNRGYYMLKKPVFRRVFRVFHSDRQMEEELNAIVDLGAQVLDVFVNHPVYGRLQAGLMLRSRSDVARFLEDIGSGKSSPLKALTDGYHFHTVEAETEEILDLVERDLEKRGFLLEAGKDQYL